MTGEGLSSEPLPSPAWTKTTAPLPEEDILLAHAIGSRVDGLLEALWNAGGTDLLLTAGTAPQIRVHGDLYPVEGTRPLTADDTESMVAEVLSPAQSAAFATQQDYDFSFSWRDQARIRGNAFIQRD